MCSSSTGPVPPDSLSPVVEGRLSAGEKRMLRQIALDSIAMGLEKNRPLSVAPEDYPRALSRPGAVFVTLEVRGRLRGCIGSCVARRALVEDVAENAYAAAFRDPRFPPLTRKVFPELDLHLSLLTPLRRLAAESRKHLLEILRPGLDGLLLEEPPRRSTFLPQVWEVLPEPDAFLEELLLKAGLPRAHWSERLVFHRYTVEEF